MSYVSNLPTMALKPRRFSSFSVSSDQTSKKSGLGVLSMRVPPTSHSTLSNNACPMLLHHFKFKTGRGVDSLLSIA